MKSELQDLCVKVASISKNVSVRKRLNGLYVSPSLQSFNWAMVSAIHPSNTVQHDQINHFLGHYLPLHKFSHTLPLLKILCILCKILIHQFWRHTKSAKHFDAKMTKVGMSSRECSDNDEEGRVHGCHYYEGADSVGPWSILHISFQSQHIRHGRTH